MKKRLLSALNKRKRRTDALGVLLWDLWGNIAFTGSPSVQPASNPTEEYISWPQPNWGHLRIPCPAVLSAFSAAAQVSQVPSSLFFYSAHGIESIKFPSLGHITNDQAVAAFLTKCLAVGRFDVLEVLLAGYLYNHNVSHSTDVEAFAAGALQFALQFSSFGLKHIQDHLRRKEKAAFSMHGPWSSAIKFLNRVASLGLSVTTVSPALRAQLVASIAPFREKSFSLLPMASMNASLDEINDLVRRLCQ